MKIIGIDSKKEVAICEVSYGELANFGGFYSTYSMKEKIKLEPGSVVKVGKCFKDAEDALRIHQEALAAAKQLKAAATRFLGFFTD